MSGTVSIHHEFKTFKFKFQPGTTLNQALEEAVTKFGLTSETTTYGIYHKNALLNLSFNFRYLNLPQGAKLDLREIDYTKLQVRIKFQVQHAGTNMNNKIFKVSPVDKIMQILEESFDIKIDFQLQVFNKMFTDKDINDTTTFLDLGVLEDQVVKVIVSGNAIGNNNKSIPLSEKKSTVSTTTTPLRETTTLNNDKSKHSSTEPPHNPNLHKPIAFQPSEHPEQKIQQILNSNMNEKNYEVDVEDAKNYQHMLTNMAHPLLKKRELLNNQAKKLVVTELEYCNIRFRFPDRSILQTSFQATESAHSLYMFINENVRYADMDYQLHLSSPYTHIKDTADMKLVADLKFGSRTLVVLETKKPGPYLKDSIELKPLDDDLDVEEVQTTTPSTPSQSAILPETPASEQPSTTNSTKQKKPFEKKISKFLRLSKK